MPPIASSDLSAASDPNGFTIDDGPVRTTTETAGGAIPQYSPVGRVTVGGKVIVSDPAAEDGSEVPIGIAANAAAAVDDKTQVYTTVSGDIAKVPLGDWTVETLTAAFDRTPINLSTRTVL